MKKWQKTWLTLLASSLAIGWIAQGEATVIKLEGVNIAKSQPLQVVIADCKGNTFEQTATYNPSIGGIDIDTSWAGPHASIFIPSLGVGYIWYNGNWVNQEGYYWNGTQRVAVPDVPQWKKHWNHYWNAQRSGARDDQGMQGREGSRGRGEGWNNGSQADTSGAYPSGQMGTMRPTDGYQDGQYDGMSQSGQPGTMRSAGGYQSGSATGSSMNSNNSRSAK